MSPAKDRDFRTCTVTIHGTTLTVDFHHRARHEAEKHGLTGSVKSGDEGKGEIVIMHLEGLGYRTDYFIEWLREGDHGFTVRRIYRRPTKKQSFDEFHLL